MDLLQRVRQVAGNLGLLDPGGNLKELDSLNVVDLVVELETAMGRTIPLANLTSESFSTPETIAAMLDGLTASES